MLESTTFRLMYLLVVFSGMFFISHVSGWTYHDDENQWATESPSCKGYSQSPVAIVEENIIYKPEQILLFEGYDKVWNDLELVNTGQTVSLKMPPGLEVYGKDLKGKYIATEIEFHWGSQNILGSEHLYQGKRYLMEAHLFHYNSEYKSYDEALVRPEGILIIGVFFEEIGYKTLTPIVNNSQDGKIISINGKGGSIDGTAYPVENLNFRQLLPSNLTCSYTYKGSIPHPPCSETVIWKIFRERIFVSNKQVEEFRHNIYELHETDLRIKVANNFRPIQPLNDRSIYGTCTPPLNNISTLSLSTMLLLFSQVGILLNI